MDRLRAGTDLPRGHEQAEEVGFPGTVDFDVRNEHRELELNQVRVIIRAN